jgi:hypothetical protein
MDKVKKFKVINLILIILLIIRSIAQIINAFASQTSIELSMFLIIAVLYLMAFIGILIKQKWGSILVIVLAIIDILFAFMVGGFFGLGAGITDLILIFLGYKKYKQISS